MHQVAMRDLLSLWMQANVQQGANGPLDALLQGLPSYSLGLSRQPPQQQVRPIPPVVCSEHVCTLTVGIQCTAARRSWTRFCM